MKIAEDGRLLRVGIIGLGERGMGQLSLLHDMKDIEISAVCDVYTDRAD